MPALNAITDTEAMASQSKSAKRKRPHHSVQIRLLLLLPFIQCLFLGELPAFLRGLRTIQKSTSQQAAKSRSGERNLIALHCWGEQRSAVGYMSCCHCRTYDLFGGSLQSGRECRDSKGKAGRAIESKGEQSKALGENKARHWKGPAFFLNCCFSAFGIFAPFHFPVTSGVV